MTTVVSSVLLSTTTLILLLLLLVPQAGAQTQWVASSSSGAANTSDECQYTNTTIAFIVDTSMSTDDVSGVMTDALHYVGDNNGAVLNFADYMLATWNFLPNDVKHFPTIQDLTTAFDQPTHISGFPNPLAMVGNIRTLYPLGNPFQPNNDWGYMIDSLVVAVQNAQPNGIIIVLGDQDELCDGRQRLGPEFSPFGFNNTERNALIDPLIIAVAQSKNVRISFYYFILANWQLDPNGCSPDPASLTGRAGPMLTVQRIANQTGGTAVFGFDLSVQMASEIKEAGKRTAVCDTDCVPDPSLGVVVDTSGSIQRIKPQTAALFVQLKKVSLSGLMRPFNSYWLSTFANPANAPVSFPTFPDMAAAMQLDETYANLREPSDPQQDTKSNDWLYLIQSLEVMVNKVGAGGYVVVITDQEGMCDLMRFPDKIYSDIMQHIINVAIFKRISFSFYAFADGVDGKHPATQDCDVTKRKPAADKMAATSSILNGEAVFDIDASTPNGLKAASLRITAGIVHQSLRVPCNNCTVNATLALVIDTSASVEDGLKSKLRDFIHELAVVEGGGWFSGFTGGFLLNTWAYLSTQLQHFASLAAMDVFAQTTVPVDPMWARRNDLEPPSNHDDWLYMIRTLNTTVPVIGKDGFIVVIGDDNQLCDADFVFHHTAAEFASIVTLAQQKRVKISLYYFATHNHYCTHMQQVPGQVLVKQIAMQTGGEYFFESDENNWWSDLTEEIIPDIKVEGARPVCPQLCPPGSVWNGVFCMHIDPCDVRPCQHGGTCHGEAYTQDFWCECPPEFYGAHCQYPCVPHSTPSNVSHALGAVIDTSDSAAYLIDSMMAAIHQMTLVTGYFDEYLLSTWEYVDPPVPHMVKSYLQVLAFMAEMDVTGGARGNKRLLQDSGLAQRNDWKYMLDSVEKILPLMGQNGVLLVLADHEQICDANKLVRMVNGIPRYPMNPDHPRVLALNVLAKALHIKIYFFVFPSSDKGWCDYAEKQVGYNEALALVAGTGGLVMDMPGYIAPDTLQSVRDSLISTVSLEGQVGRCECPRTTVLTNNLCVCPQGKTMNADGFCV